MKQLFFIFLIFTCFHFCFSMQQNDKPKHWYDLTKKTPLCFKNQLSSEEWNNEWGEDSWDEESSCLSIIKKWCWKFKRSQKTDDDLELYV